MKFFNRDFQTRLYDTIAEIESESLIEIVVIVKAQSDRYADRPVWAGLIFSALVFTFLMFSHLVFGDFLFYVLTIVSFLVGYTLSMQIKSLFRKLVGKKRMEKAVEKAARATFQKGGLRHTERKVGTLIYCSLFEQKVYILPDRGAEESLPIEEWQKLSQKLNAIFAEPNPSESLLNVLAESKAVFNQFIPPVLNDINELPNNLEVYL